jgi:lipopolysaccharide export LptBFGC system permease protein LptF
MTIGYYVLMISVEHASIWTMWPVPLLMWSPNIACVLLAGALARRGLMPPLYGETEISR